MECSSWLAVFTGNEFLRIYVVVLSYTNLCTVIPAAKQNKFPDIVKTMALSSNDRKICRDLAANNGVVLVYLQRY